MASGDEALAALIERLQNFGATAKEAVAREAAPLVQEAARVTAAAGTSPDGTAWPTKKDGGRAMPEVASKVTATAQGAAIEIAVTGGAAIQNRLKTWRRQVLPDPGKLPKGIADAVQEGARRAFAKAMN